VKTPTGGRTGNIGSLSNYPKPGKACGTLSGKYWGVFLIKKPPRIFLNDFLI
jgi:hypothetical protein